MRVVRPFRSVLKWLPPFALTATALLLGLSFFPILRGWGQTAGEIVRFRVVQILDEPVIDLEDSTPEDIGRFNSIALADVDGDSTPDLIAVNNEDDVVNVYLGVGDGTFDDPEAFDTGDASSPIAVVVADFAGPFEMNSGRPDGNLDLFVIDDLGGVALLLGDGDGDFTDSEQTIEFIEDVADFITGAVSADFDGDGRPDIAIADGDEVIFVCNDEGFLEPCPTFLVLLPDGTVITDIGVGDFDGDGSRDIVAIDPGVGLAYLIWGDGAGNFSLDNGLPPLPLFIDGMPDDARLAVTNFNGGGPADFVAISSEEFGDINGQTFVGQGGRRFGGAGFTAPALSSGIVAADFSGDGVPDLVFSDSLQLYYLDGVSNGILSGAGASDASERGGVGNRRMRNAETMKFADLNGDGLLDIVGLVMDGQEIEVAINVRNEPTPTLGPTEPPMTPGSPTPMGPTPTPTMVPPTVTATPIPTVPLGRCDYRVSTIIQASARGIVAADLNGVGGPDIAVSDGSFVHIIGNSEGFPNTTLRNCALAHLAGNPPGAPPDVSIVQVAGAGDLAVLDLGEDSSGDLEIAVVGTSGVSFLMRGGNGLFSVVSQLSVPISGRPVQIVSDYAANPLDQRRRAPLDLDGDGNTDLLVANLNATSVSILYGGAGLNQFEHVLVPIGSPTRAISAGDFNGDGRIDFVVATTNGRVSYLIQTAGPSGQRPRFSVNGTVDVGSPVLALQTGFFNDDARADVFVADAAPSARVLVTNALNLSNPTIFPAFPITNQPSAVATLLFDPIDARLDAVVAVSAANHLAFGLGAGNGGFESALQPLATGPMPIDIAVADIDLDTQIDVVTANSDGSISILITSEPPPTPTPTHTPTATPSGSSTMTPTETPTITPTMTPIGTNTPTFPTGTPTQTKAGIYELSGPGCSVGQSASADNPAAMLLFLAMLVAFRTASRVDRSRP